ncbi:hypothetical protein HMI54_006500 [Coelomomyces lativittatus]|nr:hypothetical protein HMI54_006500 [Coelomomyces lativittatus]
MGMLTSLCQDAFKVAWMTLKHFVLFWTSLSWTGWGSFLVLLVVMVSVVGMPFFFWVSIWKAYRKEIPSGVPFSWWLGHVPFLWKSKSMHLETMYALQHQVFLSTHSKNTILYMPLETSYLITSDPNNIEHILKSNFKNYVKGPLLFRKNEILLGEGIFNVDGEAWKRQRKSASLLFNVKNFKHFMFEVFMKHGQMLTKKLDDAVVHETVVDLYDLLLRFTLDAFMEIGMGGHLNSLGDTHQPAFAIAFDRAQCIVASRLTLPYPIWALLEHINGKRKEVEQCMQLVNTFADTLIQDRQRAISVETNKNDLLSLFLNPSTFNGQTIQYSNKELRDISLNFIIAGRDTTAQALSWCIFLLCQHPTVLKKLREEIDTVCKESPMELDYDRVKSLSYAHFVFKETLRLYPRYLSLLCIPLYFSSFFNERVLYV